MYPRMMAVTATTMFTIYSLPSEKDVGKKKGGRGGDKKGDAQGGQESSDEEDANQAGEFHLEEIQILYDKTQIRILDDETQIRIVNDNPDRSDNLANLDN